MIIDYLDDLGNSKITKDSIDIIVEELGKISSKYNIKILPISSNPNIKKGFGYVKNNVD